MDFKKLFQVYSNHRINEYQTYCKDAKNIEQVKELYLLNEKCSMYLFNIISNIEIILRNRIQNAINQNYQYWYQEDKNNNVNIFNVLKDDKKNSLQTQIKKELASINKHINNKKSLNNQATIENLLISRLNFGFWNFIIANNIDAKHNVIYNQNFLNLIPIKKIPTAKFINFSSEIERLNTLRNRIAHNEIIIKNLIILHKDFEHCKSILKAIADSDTYKYILSKADKIIGCKFQDIFTEIKAIHKNG
jgi:hypothetical protein